MLGGRVRHRRFASSRPRQRRCFERVLIIKRHGTWSSRLVRRWRSYPKEALGRPSSKLVFFSVISVANDSHAAGSTLLPFESYSVFSRIPSTAFTSSPQTKATSSTYNDLGSRNIAHYLNERIKFSHSLMFALPIIARSRGSILFSSTQRIQVLARQRRYREGRQLGFSLWEPDAHVHSGSKL